MPEGLVNMSKQFGNLPMESLIGAPMSAVAKANAQLVTTNAKFIQDIGMIKDENGQLQARMVPFKFDKLIENADGTVETHEVEMKVPMLATVQVPALSIKEANVSFDMSVNSSTEDSSSSDSEASLDATVKVGFGLWSVSAKIHGKTSSHQSHTRKSDNSAKYHVDVRATDEGAPEGLMRVLDIMADAITPAPSTKKADTPAPAPKKKDK